ncbi:30S ribosomal protein S6 [Patescibacteria group bacterium]|nr:30S ribosomal protein S6 [Patescibacteria group bacterium]
MRNYELTLLLKVGLMESELQELLGGIASMLQDEGALIISQDSKGRRALPALVKKHSEAELTVVKFALDPQKLKGVEKSLRAKESILRFALLSYIPQKAKERTIAKTVATSITHEPTEEEKVEIGDIDKKLEEIFKDDNL